MRASARAGIGAIALLLACPLASCATGGGQSGPALADDGYADDGPADEAAYYDGATTDIGAIPTAELTMTELQELLIARGYEPGDADGDWGPRTQRAVFAFQGDCELPPTGQLDAATREALADVSNGCEAR